MQIPLRPAMSRRSPIRTALLLVLTCAIGACAPVEKPMGPPVAAPALAHDALIAADGAALPLRVWMPRGRPEAVLIGLHGFNDYSNAFAMPAPFWAERGIATYAWDQRGFGAAPDRGYWPGEETLAADLRAAVRAVRARHPDTPLFLLGVSMGGAVVMTTLAERPIEGVDGTILVAPAVWGRRHMGVLERSALWLVSHTMPWLTLSGRGLDIVASDNFQMLRALGRDPLVIKETRADAIGGLVDLMDAAFAAAPRLDGTPLLFAYGSRDEIVPKEPVLAVMRRLARNDGARIALYDSGYHMLLRDLSAETVWRDIAAWVSDRGAPLPSGAERRAEALLARQPARPIDVPPPGWDRARSGQSQRGITAGSRMPLRESRG